VGVDREGAYKDDGGAIELEDVDLHESLSSSRDSKFTHRKPFCQFYDSDQVLTFYYPSQRFTLFLRRSSPTNMLNDRFTHRKPFCQFDDSDH
jgi:hypothetical protein